MYYKQGQKNFFRLAYCENQGYNLALFSQFGFQNPKLNIWIPKYTNYHSNIPNNFIPMCSDGLIMMFMHRLIQKEMHQFFYQINQKKSTTE